MDFGTFSGLYTAFLILIFIGIFAWAYSKRRKKDFEEAANLVFADEVNQKHGTSSQGAKPQ
ncbi:cbb3-type cytochrome c oxidase subunit 3 [Alginatibacterium sediminis]|uniref:Cbb3-type cytochrome c oxidase subunit 3 n=1 Tax=Alginatibacterium sediminis TaxID=2164068 RepID=A0A420EH61_9ALTE|nr:cbb3-type cytochrome c oxidase subunit 3 [Alginatibacterium sediminis]RKF20023.1 cbb3-type cytochrome c oxidase subunit 3 [Alginatibacterium sediminis]